MKSQKITNALLIMSVIVFIFGSGFKMGQYSNRLGAGSSAAHVDSKAKNLDFSMFWDVWGKLQEKYVDKKKLDTNKMYFGAIKGMVTSIEDPYTFFLTPSENKQSKDDLGGKFEGIGAQLGLKEKQVVIVAPLKNSPSEKAGLKAGDVVTKVNNESIIDLPLPQVVNKIRGEKGTKVTITIERNGQSQNFTMTRDEIKVSSVELTYDKATTCDSCLPAADVKINQFGENTNDEWTKAVEEVSQKWQKKEISGLILDLRDNPGGYLESAVYIASEFIPQDKLIVKQESTVTPSHDYYSMRDGKLLDIPVAVLINQGSASASEILSGALRDYKRATLIGEKSFGKGSVQEALDLGNGAGLHVTVAKWLLPKGDWINGKGIQPDVTVKNELKEGNTLTKENDQQLETALENIVK